MDKKNDILNGEECALEIISEYKGYIIDLDGVLWKGTVPVKGGPDVINRLMNSSKKIRFVSNSSTRSLRDTLGKAENFGFSLSEDQLFLSCRVMAEKISCSLSGSGKVFVIGSEGLIEELKNFDLELVSEEKFMNNVDFVVVGNDREFSFFKMRMALRAFEGGAKLAAVNLDPTAPSSEGLIPAGGAIVAALKVLKGDKAEIMPGKPRPDLLLEAADDMGLEVGECLMIGDTPQADIEASTRAGMDSSLVFTGKFEVDDLPDLPQEHKPDFIISSIAELIKVF